MANIKFVGEVAASRIADYINQKLTFVSSMPQSPALNTIVMYIGTTTSSYVQGSVYQYNGTVWQQISSVQAIELTQLEYDALSPQAKNNGTIYFVTDAETGIVYGYLNTTDGKFYRENTYTTEVPANSSCIYIDLSTNLIYRYDATNTEYVSVGGSGGSANIVNCTQAEYDALPSSKESDDVLYVVYFDGGQILDPDYSYYTYGDNDEIIVRVYHEGQLDQQTLWFFRGWNQTSGDMAIPTELTSYKPANPSSAIFSANYPNGGTSQDGWIGFYNNNIRAWTQSLAETTTGMMYGVVDIVGGDRQSLPYVDDPYIYIPDSNATRRIYMNGREYAEFNNGGGSSWIDIQGTLLAGNTSVTLNNPSIKNTSNFEFFTDVFGVCPTNVSVSNGSITLTFDAQANDLGVKVRVTNPTTVATYSYLKWQLLKTKGNPPHAGALQVSEFYIGVNGSDYSWGNATITSNMAGASAQQNVTSLIDGDILTKYCTVEWGSIQTNECNITITLDGSISASDITGYAFVTGEDEPSRDPISWKLYGSSDGTNWVLIDEQTDYNVTTERRTRESILL